MTPILTPQQAARFKKIKAVAAKVRADKQRRVRDRIEELTREKYCENNS